MNDIFIWVTRKRLLTFTGLLPFFYSLYQIYVLQTGGSHTLGADPAKALVHLQGEWAIRFLVLVLLVSPLRRLFGWSGLQKYRRQLGLFVFFYASLHLLCYVVFLLELQFSNLLNEIVKRPYITVGMLAYLLLAPLAITSTDLMMRRLRKRWQILHRLVYPASILVVLHYFWLTKADYTEPLIYGACVAILLVFRLIQTSRNAFIPAGRKYW